MAGDMIDVQKEKAKKELETKASAGVFEKSEAE